MEYFIVEEKNTKGYGQSYLLRSINPSFEESEFVAYLNGRVFKGTIVNVTKEKDEKKLLKFAEIMGDYICYRVDGQIVSSLKEETEYRLVIDNELENITTESDVMTISIQRKVEHFSFILLSACRRMFPELEEVYNGSYFTIKSK